MREEQHVEIVTAPDGTQWTVRAGRPRHGTSPWQVTISSVAGLARHREWLDPDADPANRVEELVSAVQSGAWPT
jgi:hypothetical protein